MKLANIPPPRCSPGVAFLRIFVAVSLITFATPIRVAGVPGSILWQHSRTNIDVSFANPTPAIGADGTVYLPNGAYMDALSPAGELKWRFDSSQPRAGLQTPMIRRDGTVMAALAGPTVDIEPTEDALRSAILAGGRITFRTNGVIRLTQPLTIRRDTLLEAEGREIVIDGQGATRLFSIHDAGLGLVGLHLVNAAALGQNAVMNDCLVVSSAEPGCGGTIYSSNATLYLESCLISNSTARGGSGTEGIGTCLTPPAPAYGGALYALHSKFVITNCTFSQCAALGGDWQEGFSFRAAGGAGGGAIYAQDSELAISNAQFSTNSAPGAGSRLSVSDGFGGAFLLSNTVAEVRASSFRGNSSGSGGAVFTDAALRLVDSSFDCNAALAPGSYGGGRPARGGALCFVSSNTLSTVGCSFTRNYANGGQGGSPGGYVPGGATEGAGIYAFPGLLTMTNSVLALNTNAAAFLFFGEGHEFATGAGLYCSNAIIEYCTIASNIVTLGTFPLNSPGGGSNVSGIFTTGVVSLHAVILSNAGTNAWGHFVDQGYNLSSDNSVQFSMSTSRSERDALLGPFQTDDGFLGYLIPLEGSPALDSADPFQFPATDLRGVERPNGAAPDIGAIERTPRPMLSISRSGDLIHIHFERAFGGDLVVETSSDLLHWEPLNMEPSPSSITIPPAEQRSARFYRLREIQP